MVWYGLVWSGRLKNQHHELINKVGIELLGQLKNAKYFRSNIGNEEADFDMDVKTGFEDQNQVL